MTQEINLKASTRENKDSKKNNQNTILAVMYGAKIKNQNLALNKIDFEKIYKIAGESNLINLIIDDQPATKVLIKDIQVNPIKDNIIHADFYQVDMNKTIITEIPLNFIGEAPAVKEFGGVLIKNNDKIEIECLPGNLVNQIDIDLSSLKSFSDVIRIKDIELPEGIKLVSETNEAIVNVQEPKVEEEPAEEAVEGEGGEEAKIEGEDAKKEDGEAEPKTEDDKEKPKNAENKPEQKK